ncbi:MAG TPA: glycosyltransferase, partial [Firmicutes bacterium]|nr:glycosyltransferase [Bacillota bacterium]
MTDAESLHARVQERNGSTPQLSLVIPLLNEVESIRPLYDRIISVLEAESYTAEIIFVDDGSRDGSYDVIGQIAE